MFYFILSKNKWEIKLKPELLAELKQKTAFSEKYIKNGQFNKDFPAGLIMGV